MERSRERACAAVVLVTASLLAAGVRLSEDPTVAAVARAMRARPLTHATAAAGWAAQMLLDDEAPVRIPRARCEGRRGK
jgi:hypothetical protein